MTEGIIITFVICAAISAIVIIPLFHDYNLKKARIKADAMVRAEEIKAKNQLEIEKLLYNQQHNTARNVESCEEEYNNTQARIREKL